MQAACRGHSELRQQRQQILDCFAWQLQEARHILLIHSSDIAQEIGGWGVSDAATSKYGMYETSDMLMGKCVPNGGGTSGDPYWDNP